MSFSLERLCQRGLPGVLPMLLALSAQAAPLAVDGAKSQVAITFRQMNVPVEARFKRVQARLDFSSAKPEESRGEIDIDLTSFDLGDPEYNKEVLKKEWFDAVRYPKAHFVLTGLTGRAPGTLDARGQLTLKGKTQTLRFPLTVRQDGRIWHFEGQLAIRRLAFEIGEGEWKDTGMLADEVLIRFHLLAQ